MNDIAKNVGLAFIIKIMSSILSFGFNVAIARLLGAEGAGIYFLALAVTSIGSIFGRLGLDNALLRFIAINAVKNDLGSAKGVYSLGMYLSIAACSITTILIFLSSSFIATHLFHKPELAEPLRWMSLSILPFSLLNLQAESLKGLKKISSAMIIQGTMIPLLSLILILPLSQFDELIGATVTYTLATISTAILGQYIWWKSIKTTKIEIRKFSIEQLWKSCCPLFMVALMNKAILPWSPLFILGIWASSDEVGVFAIATRVSMLVTFLLATINNVLAPKFAELITKNDMITLGQTARRSALLITLLTSPIFMLLILKGDWVMLKFGSEFEKGAIILSILAIGQLVNVLTGSVGYLLIMAGYEAIFKTLTIWSTAILLIASVILIPYFHGVGAAIAVTLAVTINNLGAVLIVYRKMGIKTIVLT